MANYKEIHGQKMKVLSSDPLTPSPGDFWYNSTDYQVKGYYDVTIPSTWVSGGNMGTSRHGLGGCGTQTAGLGFGGYVGPTTTATEQYDGSAWTAGGNLSTERYNMASAGTQTAGLAFGGTPGGENATEEYDGSVWTVGGNLNVSKKNLAGAGTQTAGLGFGGYTYEEYDPETGMYLSNTTAEYDGSTWTAGGNLSTRRHFLAGAGTQTAGLGFGGEIDHYTYTKTNATEEYDGSAWTAGGNLGTANYRLAGAGTQTAGLGFGGYSTIFENSTEEYDGSAWTAGGNLGTARQALAGAGTLSSGLAFGGYGDNYSSTNSTEEYGGGFSGFGTFRLR